jgi:hypothetical protein
MIGFYDLQLNDVLKKMHSEDLSYNEAVAKLEEERWMEERTKAVNEASSDEYDRIVREDIERDFREMDALGDYAF